MINKEFVPVWINIRHDPLPRREAVKHALVNAKLNDEWFVKDPFSQGFFVRSVVLSPTGDKLLNPQENRMGMGYIKMFSDGALGYAEVNWGAYISMLKKSLENHYGWRTYLEKLTDASTP